MLQTDSSTLDQAIEVLRESAPRLAQMGPEARIELVEDCLRSVAHVVDQWIKAGCHAKRLDPHGSEAAEEIGAGPLPTVRYLKLLLAALDDTRMLGQPKLPGEPRLGPGDQVIAPVFPTREGLYDSLLFAGYKAEVRMLPGVTLENLKESTAGVFRQEHPTPSVCLILGAGNVSSIAATDMLTKIFQEGRTVLLKMNPVNEYLGPIFEKAFERLIREGFLRMVYGGADIGSQAAYHKSVDAVHVTGSTATHEAIVWGADPSERERRKAANDPKLDKTITSELGNITPWIIVPGEYTERQLSFQAENLAAAIANNVSFNCVAPKMIVTSRSWAQREEFLNKLRDCLAKTPRRFAYYPGALERFEQFTGEQSTDGQVAKGPSETNTSSAFSPPTDQNQAEDDTSLRLPWTVREEVNPRDHALLFEQESFVCVLGETSLDAADADAFVDTVGQFVNENIWGALAAAVIVPEAYRKNSGGQARFERLLSELKYGTVCVNQWPGLAFAMMCCPWGGFPGATPQDPKSGVGWVHNTYFLDKAEKTVLEGPLVVWPKPLWFQSNQSAAVLARRVLDLYIRPRWWKLIGISMAALGFTRKS